MASTKLALEPRLLRAYEADGRFARLYEADARDLLLSLEPAATDVVLLNLANVDLDAIDVAHAGRGPGDGLQVFLANLIAPAAATLRQGGALFLLCPPGPASRIAPFVRSHPSFRHWIAPGHAHPASPAGALHPEHWALLFFTKGEPALDDGRLALTDFWSDLPGPDPLGTDEISEDAEAEIARRIILLAGAEGGSMVDPLGGSGGAAAAALEQGLSVTVGARAPGKLVGASARIERSVPHARRLP